MLYGDVRKFLTDMVRERGDMVAYNMHLCVAYTKENGQNCRGCLSDLGCGKVAVSLLLLAKGKYIQDDRDVEQRLLRILNAKTIEEVKAEV